MVGKSTAGTQTVSDYKLTPEKVVTMFKELDPSITVSALSSTAASKEMDKFNETVDNKLRMRFWIIAILGVLLGVAAIAIIVMFFRGRGGSGDGR